ncbi:MAG TPA: imelysin family protein [Verrucomicrobiales bacterium]|nr:imelysin family protein [Verrucomicrobiales bacterium]
MKRLLCMVLLATAISSPAEDPDAVDARMAAEAAQTCFRIIEANYGDCVTQAQLLEKAVTEFTAKPSAARLKAARQAWITARKSYAPSEAYRFCGGPIDSEGGPEELLNAWPIDEAVIDRVPGSTVVSIIEDTKSWPVLDAKTLTELNMKDGEKNVTCGWHAVEFLLWGQDTSADGPGNRPFTDYTTAPHANRRREFLSVSTHEITRHLKPLCDAWKPGVKGNYRAQRETTDADDALRTVVRGMVTLSGFELASERIRVPCETRMQEEEHSCFSDTTTFDIQGNIQGMVNLWQGKYRRIDGTVIQGVSIKDLTEKRDADLAKEITQILDDATAMAAKLPVRFDQAILEPVSGPGQQALRKLSEKLDLLSRTLKRFAERMGRPYTAAELEG